MTRTPDTWRPTGASDHPDFTEAERASLRELAGKIAAASYTVTDQAREPVVHITFSSLAERDLAVRAMGVVAAEPDAVRTIPSDDVLEKFLLVSFRRWGFDDKTIQHVTYKTWKSYINTDVVHRWVMVMARDILANFAVPAPAVHDEQHIARFLARLIYRRGVAYGKGLESIETWVDAHWQSFREDARRLGGEPIPVAAQNAESRYIWTEESQ